MRLLTTAQWAQVSTGSVSDRVGRRHKKTRAVKRGLTPSLTLRVLTSIVAAIISLPFGAAPTQAQQDKKPQKGAGGEEVVTVSSRLVNVDVSVKDKKGNYVNDLKAEDFRSEERRVGKECRVRGAT